MRAGDLVVARRYARALLEVALLPSAPPGEAARVRAALDEASALLVQNPDLLRALTHPLAKPEARRRVAAAVWKDAPELVRRLFGLLVDRERMGLVGAIARAYAEAWNASRGVVAAQAVSAAALDAGQHGELRAALEKATGRGVELQAAVDPGVLGGLKVTVGGRTIDGTVRARLLALKRSLRGAA